MTQKTENTPATLTVKLSTWFEASATGWGVVAVALIVLALLFSALAVRVP